jgi:hypothetical protein
MTFYQELDPGPDPFDNGTDDNGRQLLTFNVRAVRAGTSADTFVEELVNRLHAMGVGTFNVDIFAGASSVLPPKATIISIRASGGAPPLRSQNTISPPAFARPAAQITAHAATYALAKAKARAAYNALALRNVNLT